MVRVSQSPYGRRNCDGAARAASRTSPGIGLRSFGEVGRAYGVGRSAEVV